MRGKALFVRRTTLLWIIAAMSLLMIDFLGSDGLLESRSLGRPSPAGDAVSSATTVRQSDSDDRVEPVDDILWTVSVLAAVLLKAFAYSNRFIGIGKRPQHEKPLPAMEKGAWP